MATKKQSPIEREYARNRKRIQSAIRRLENRGYLVPSNILPERPKRITPASVRRLENITIEKLYKKSEYVVQETGEILPGSKGKKVENQLRTEYRSNVAKENAKKRKQPVETTDYVNFDEQILQQFQYDMFEVFQRNPRFMQYIVSWYERALRTYGPADLAEALEKAKASGQWPGWQAVSDEELLTGSLNTILELIGGSKGVREELMESLEIMEDWNEPE